MVLHGRIENGAVVFAEHVKLPEGTQVTVVIEAAKTPGPALPADRQRRVKLPLVASKHPGSRPLTADRVAELLDEDDASA